MKELIKDFVGLYLDMAKDCVELYAWLWKDNKETNNIKETKECDKRNGK